MAEKVIQIFAYLLMKSTIMTDIEPESPLRTEEIFGSILPVITYSALPEVVKRMQQKEKTTCTLYFQHK